MATLADALTELVQQAAIAAGHGSATVDPCVPTNNPEHGDYQSNFAFRLGKATKQNPRALAQAIVDHLPASPMVKSASVAGPGFINLTLTDEHLAADVVERAKDPWIGTPRVGHGKTMVIDYSSPNIAKRMHVGHLRSTVIGNALDRMHRFLGWTVVADNHLGDWGTQFGMLIVAWREWRDDAAYEQDPIAELQRLYVLFREKAKEDPTLEDRARAETAKLQEGDADNRALWSRFVEVSLREFDELYRRMDVRFDVTLGESAYREHLQPLVDRLLAKGQAEVSEGAVVVPLEGMPPLLIRKSDGSALYGTTDLATVEYRLNHWSPDRIVYVTDVRQKLHFQQVFAACKKLGIEANLVHVAFGMLRLPDGAVVATRKGPGGAGQSLNLVDVFDTARDHARKVVDEKSGHLDEHDRDVIAEAVGVGAIRYADLSQNPTSDITFEWSKMLALEGNTAPYLMYAYARCQSIFRKADISDFVPGNVVLSHPAERELALAVARLSEAVLDAAATSRPNVLCDHLFHLASTFARFYGACHVLGEAPEVTWSRLSLVHATARALEVGMEILGLRALDRM
jgi:arginyl-tRNA synthetase